MPTIRLTAVDRATDEQIQAFMEGVTDLAETVLGARREGVIVHVERIPARHYMRGGITIEDRLAGKTTS